MKPARFPKYWLLNALSTGSALLFAFLLLVGHRWISDRQGLLEDIQLQATLVGANASVAVAAGDPAMGEDMLAAVANSPQIQEAVMYRENGNAFVRFDRSNYKHLPEHVPALGHVFTSSDLTVTVPVKFGTTPVGWIAVRASLAGLYESILQFAGGLIATAAIATLLGHLASHSLRQRMERAEQDLRLLALYDRVTGLANRHAFELAIEQTLLRHQRDGDASALLFIDVDGFKKINDRFGHRVGDKVLEEIGERITFNLRASDIVARLGGDEFGAILVNTSSPADAAHVAENLVREAAKPFISDKNSLHIGFSIGIAMIPADGDTAATLMHHADLAMYHAKQLGKGNFQFFSDTLGSAVKRRLDIEEGLRQAMAKGELFVVYQPQVAHEGDAPSGLEALVRWRGNDGSVIPPAEFIPVAEESGLIADMGKIVLEQVCTDIRRLRDAGYRVPTVAVNVSGQQFNRRSLVQDMRNLLDTHGLVPSDIEVELTESALMDRFDDYRQIMHDFSTLGIRIAIDDFGIGYSSFGYLRKLPVSKLKIDRSFVQDLPDNSESVTIVNGIVSMAHALGLRVVAEGVEKSAQAECLLTHGCDLLQGYLTGRPMAADKLPEILAKA